MIRIICATLLKTAGLVISHRERSQSSNQGYLIQSQSLRQSHEIYSQKLSHKNNIINRIIHWLGIIITITIIIIGVRWCLDLYFKGKKEIIKEQSINIKNSDGNTVPNIEKRLKYSGNERDQIIILNGKSVYIDKDGYIIID